MEVEFLLTNRNEVDGCIIYKGNDDDHWPIKIELTKEEMLQLFNELNEFVTQMVD